MHSFPLHYQKKQNPANAGRPEVFNIISIRILNAWQNLLFLP
jgi:hypothetical protein